MKKILITYFTKTNTTKEISEEIATTLNEKGLQTSILPMDQVKEFSDYAGVIIGAPIFGMQWAKEAADFVSKHELALKETKTALFFNSYMIYAGRKMWQKAVNKSLDSISQTLNPVAIGKFGGRIEGSLPAPMRFIFGIKKDTPFDQRNIEMIKSWAKDTAVLF